MERKDAAQLVVDLGGKSSKLKKAEKVILDGQDLEILSENVFYDLISNN